MKIWLKLKEHLVRFFSPTYPDSDEVLLNISSPKPVTPPPPVPSAKPEAPGLSAVYLSGNKNEFLSFGFGRMLAFVDQLEELARSGSTEAEKAVADAYYAMGNRFYHGTGVRKDAVEAFNWFTKSAAYGHRGAQFRLALMYQNQDGTHLSILQARNWLFEAAGSTYPLALEYLGFAHEKGWLGYSPDTQEAQKWYSLYNQTRMTKPLSANDAYIYGKQYELYEIPNREFGITSIRSPIQSVFWYNYAARNGSLKAMDRLGLAYENGELWLSKDPAKAQYWYRLYNRSIRALSSPPWDKSDPALQQRDAPKPSARTFGSFVNSQPVPAPAKAAVKDPAQAPDVWGFWGPSVG